MPPSIFIVKFLYYNDVRINSEKIYNPDILTTPWLSGNTGGTVSGDIVAKEENDNLKKELHDGVTCRTLSSDTGHSDKNRETTRI